MYLSIYLFIYLGWVSGRPDLLPVLHLPDDVWELHPPQRVLGYRRGLPRAGAGDDRTRGEGQRR